MIVRVANVKLPLGSTEQSLVSEVARRLNVSAANWTLRFVDELSTREKRLCTMSHVEAMSHLAESGRPITGVDPVRAQIPAASYPVSVDSRPAGGCRSDTRGCSLRGDSQSTDTDRFC